METLNKTLSISELVDKIIADYQSNYRPRKEIQARLSEDVLYDILHSTKVRGMMKTSWHFKFYFKQLMLLSMKDIEAQSSEKASILLRQMKQDLEPARDEQMNSLIGHLRLEFGREKISDLELYEMFGGTTYYDDYCAQIAYEEWLKRKKK
jgi:hypothetical protein